MEAVALARRAGFDNVSVDLLYDVPGQTTDSWRASLRHAIALGVDHVSAYALSLDDPDADGLTEPGGDHLPLSPGARRWRGRARLQQNDDRAAEMYTIAEEELDRAGFAWYELSNWARPGRQSRHNLAYWHGRPWEAVGPGAHAFDGARTRSWNAARLDRYLAALLPTDERPARLPPGGHETTSEETAAAEQAILRLRTRAGLPRQIADRYSGTLGWAQAHELIETDAVGNQRLTLRGRLLSNEVFVRLLPRVAAPAA